MGDIFDFTVGRIPVIGTLIDLIGGFLAMTWGKIGVFAFWEIIDITNQSNAFVPSLTIIGLISIIKGR